MTDKMPDILVCQSVVLGLVCVSFIRRGRRKTCNHIRPTVQNTSLNQASCTTTSRIVLQVEALMKVIICLQYSYFECAIQSRVLSINAKP
jgi:hypothetical protein